MALSCGVGPSKYITIILFIDIEAALKCYKVLFWWSGDRKRNFYEAHKTLLSFMKHDMIGKW